MGRNLFDVIRRNSARQVKLLLEAGCEVNARDPGGGASALMEAVLLPEGSRALVVRLLLDAGADSGFSDRLGLTALIMAAVLDRQDVVMMLLQTDGVELDAVDKYGNSALMYACALGHTEVVRLLVTAGTSGGHVLDLQRSNKDRLTAADLAAYNGHTQLADVIARLISAEAEEETDCVSHVPRPYDVSSLASMQTVIEELRGRATAIERLSAGSAKFLSNPRHSPGLISPSPTGSEPKREGPGRPRSRTRSQESRASSRGSLVKVEVGVASKKGVVRGEVGVASRKVGGVRGRGGRAGFMGEELEEDDLSLQSLGELVSNMRECAREIREICAPLEPGDPRGAPTTGPARPQPRGGKGRKPKQGRVKKPKITLTATFDSSQGKTRLAVPSAPDPDPGSPDDPEHASDELPGAETPVPRGVLAAPPRLAPTLRVENETLSKSWPRSRSKNRSLTSSFNGSDSGPSRQEASTPCPSTGPAPRRRKPLPPEELMQSCQSEKEILGRLFSKMTTSQGEESAGVHPAPNPLPQGPDAWSPFGAPLPAIHASEHDPPNP